LWLSKYLGMDKLPAIVFLDVIREVESVVARDIATDCPEEDHANHHAEEDANNGAVDQAEPMDAAVRELEVRIPTCRQRFS